MDNAMKMIGDIQVLLKSCNRIRCCSWYRFCDTWFFGDVLTNLLGVVSLDACWFTCCRSLLLVLYLAAMLHSLML